MPRLPQGARGRPRSTGRDVPTSRRTDRSTIADDHLAHAADTGREEVVMLLRERDASVLDQPSLEWYRKRAKRLLKAARGGDAETLAGLGETLSELPQPLRLADVQRA